MEYYKSPEFLKFRVYQETAVSGIVPQSSGEINLAFTFYEGMIYGLH